MLTESCGWIGGYRCSCTMQYLFIKHLFTVGCCCCCLCIQSFTVIFGCMVSWRVVSGGMCCCLLLLLSVMVVRCLLLLLTQLMMCTRFISSSSSLVVFIRNALVFCIRISFAVQHGQTCCLTLPSSTKHNHGICKQQEQHQS